MLYSVYSVPVYIRVYNRVRSSRYIVAMGAQAHLSSFSQRPALYKRDGIGCLPNSISEQLASFDSRRHSDLFSRLYLISYEKTNLKTLFIFEIYLQFGCHIDATKQQRALNFELVVSDQLFSVILVAYN